LFIQLFDQTRATLCIRHTLVNFFFSFAQHCLIPCTNPTKVFVFVLGHLSNTDWLCVEEVGPSYCKYHFAYTPKNNVVPKCIYESFTMMLNLIPVLDFRVYPKDHHSYAFESDMKRLVQQVNSSPWLQPDSELWLYDGSVPVIVFVFFLFSSVCCLFMFWRPPGFCSEWRINELAKSLCYVTHIQMCHSHGPLPSKQDIPNKSIDGSFLKNMEKTSLIISFCCCVKSNTQKQEWIVFYIKLYMIQNKDYCEQKLEGQKWVQSRIEPDKTLVIH